jgi:alginate O-acetyltransferase complex protein AlgI
MPWLSGMLFTEPLFLFLFLPVVFVLWLLAAGLYRTRLRLFLMASVLFYTWGEPRFVPVVICSALLDYALSRPIARGSSLALKVGIIANLAILLIYKYLDFLAGNLALALHGSWTLPQIALPIGVSFVVFEKITYLVDVHRGRSPPATGFGFYLTYVLFFPKLLAGPIIKYHEINEQLCTPQPARPEWIMDGFFRFMVGVIKKVLLADIIGAGADGLFSLPSDRLGFLQAWEGIVLFTLQIYLDFSAYSDMAIGLARMFGYELRENFNQPYISCSITEFWHRWHISLSTWVREYLYIPLGGNRAGRVRTILNLWVCFLASGAWHGAAWTYVLWGAYHGLFLVLDKLFLLRLLDRLPTILANIATLLVVMVGWAIFRASSIDQLVEFLSAMVNPNQAGLGIFWPNDLLLATMVGVAACAAPRLPGIPSALVALARPRPRAAVHLAGLAMFALALSRAIADPFKPFLYFRF